MNKQHLTYSQRNTPVLNHHRPKLSRLLACLADLKLLVKAPVLIANVLPVLAGFWLALYFSNTTLVEWMGACFVVLVGSTFVMAGALVLNNWYDADIDALMARTKKRPTVTGKISLKTVLMIGILFTVMGMVMISFVSIESAIYAFIGWFTYVFLYTMWSKRRYTMNTLIGSVSGAVTPLIGWSAVASSMHIVPILLFAVLLIWQMPHTYAIAIRKYEEYKAAKVAMLPVVHGIKVTKRHIAFYVAFLLPIPFFMKLGFAFIVLATILNVIWLGISIGGLFTSDDETYAHLSFKYSVHYLLLFFILLIVVTLP